jgi:hypothetical protein
MHGKDVLTIDDEKVGHVVGEDGDFLLVEHGLLKTKHAIPLTFVEQDGEHYRTTLSKHLIHDSPKVNGDLDRVAVAEHYGLAEGYEDPLTRGDGELLPDDPARTAEEDAVKAGVDPVQERIEVREGLTSGHGRLDQGDSPGITGGDRFRDAPGGKQRT